MTIVANFTVTYPQRTDILVSEMLYSLWQAIISMSEGSIDHHSSPNPTGYIVTCVTKHLQKEMGQYSILKVAHKRRRIYTRVRFVEDQMGFLSDKTKELETLILKECCHTDRERQIVQLRLEGLGDLEIAKKLSLSKVRVGQIRKEIFEEYTHVR